MRKGEVYTTKIVDFGASGEGVAKVDSVPVFIPQAIKGETVKFKIVHAKKDYAFGEILEIVETAECRVKPKCIHFGRCGGCDLQHIDYAAQKQLKIDSVFNTLKKIAAIDKPIENIYGGQPFYYRNKLSLPFGTKNGKVVLGFYEKKSHQLVPLKDCPLHGEWLRPLIKEVTEWATENGISVYDEKTGKGLLRHLVARYLDTLSVTLVINGDKIPTCDKLYEKLKKVFGSVALYISANRENTNVILGKSAKLIFGTEQKQSLGNFEAVISPLSFLQVNKEVMKLLYDGVAENLKDEKSLLELYSGVGLLTAQILTRISDLNVTCVEIEKSATLDAEKLMADIGAKDRAKIICSDAGEFMKKNFTANFYDSVILDPPRKGCDSEILEAINKSSVKKIVYVSCNPATLARDLKLLTSFEIKSIKLYDLFAQTSHVETVVVLKRKVKGEIIC